MLLASVEDLSRRLGLTLTEGSADYLRAEANLRDASALVELATRRWSEHESIPDVVHLVTLQAALRTFRNPEGAIQRGMGPWSETTGVTGVYLTDPEKALLADFQEKAHGGITSVPIRRDGERSTSGCEWAWVPGSEEPIPYFPPGWPVGP